MQRSIYIPKDKTSLLERAKQIYGGSISSLVLILVERYVKSHEQGNLPPQEGQEVKDNEGNEGSGTVQ